MIKLAMAYVKVVLKNYYPITKGVTMRKLEKFDQTLQDIESAILAIIGRIGPLFVALIPAMFTGYSVYITFQANPIVGYVFAVVTAIGLEVSGIKIVHTCVDMFRAGQTGKARLMVGASLGYAIAVAIIIIYAHEAFSPLVRGLGIGSPFLALLCYMAVAFSREVEHSESGRTVEKQAAAERRQQLKLAQIEAEKQVKLAQAQARPVASIASNVDAKIDAKIDAVDPITRAILDGTDATESALAERFDVSRSTITRRKRALRKTGMLNGTH